MEYTLLDFNVLDSRQGNAVNIESENSVPFDIKRIYYIFNTERYAVRGRHAHHNLEQAIICVSGACDFILDDGKERETIHLDDPSRALYIKNNIWREFTNFTEDCVVMVLASEHYNEDDYIRDYNKFIDTVNFEKNK